MYVSPDGASVESLNLVRHGSRLTGTASVLAAISSDDAELSFGVLDAQERPVPGSPINHPVTDDAGVYTAPSDNAACGGTPMCFQALTGPVDGQVGAKHRISVRIVWTDYAPFGPTSSVGTVRGNGFTLDGDKLKPTDDAHIAAARARAIGNLRSVAIPAHQVQLEITALRGPFYSLDKKTWDQLLADDVYALREQVNVADHLKDPLPTAQLGCGYSELVKRDIEQLQSHINDEAAEISKAEKLLGSLSPAATRAAGGGVATVRETIKARRATIDQKVRQANVSVGKANADAPKVETFLQQAECGAIHIGAHALLEAGD
jgi:hypothetical protein